MLRYFISKEFFLTLLGLIILGTIGVVLLFTVFLPSYTQHGSGLIVPSIYEMEYETAVSKLERIGLNPVVVDCTYIEDLPSLIVVQQRPVALSRVKKDRTVFLTLNKISPPMVEIPNVVDLSLYHAKATLENWKLRVGKVSFVPDIATNVVLEAKLKGEDIKPGNKVAQGTTIDLVVGRSTANFQVQIPNLVGYTHEEAVQLLQESGLRLGRLSFNPDGPREYWGRVFSQDPQSGYQDSIRLGDPVDLYLYGAPPEESEGIEVEEGVEIQ